MTEPSTKILDHIVHLTPPGTVELAAKQFRELGFNVIAGGTHSGGLTANSLVILADGVYLELIAFTHPISHYPPGSPDRSRRETEPWASKDPGWIDFAFLGPSAPGASAARTINARARLDGSGAHYDAEVRGGRVRADGKVLKWLIASPSDPARRGVLPFFCGDVTPREWRVPTDPPSNASHDSGALGIAHIRVLVPHSALQGIAAQLTSVVGDLPMGGEVDDTDNDGHSEYEWVLDTPGMPPGLGAHEPRLILAAPADEEEEDALLDRGPGVYEVSFWVKPGGNTGVARTPYGKIVWQTVPNFLAAT